MDDRTNRYGPYGPTGYNDSGTPGDYTRDYGSGRDYTYSSARDYAAAGELGRGRDRGQRDDGYRGRQDRAAYGAQGYGQRREERSGWSDGGRDWNDTGSRSYGGYGTYGDRDDRQRSYAGGDWGNRDSVARGYGPQDRGRYGQDRNRQDDRELRGYDRDRGFLDRAGDEVRSWFGDEEAERRRRQDQRYDELQARQEGGTHDNHYGEWRRSRIAEFDRDYDEYRRENAQRFHSEFESWRTERTGQRESLRRVTEHMEVLGSDGAHVGTVDKVRGDRILLTKSDTDAEGRHHSIPSRWIQTVDDKVHLRKTADEAKNHWRDEERSGALFGDDQAKSSSAADQNATREGTQDWNTAGNLNASFKGTY